LERARSVHWLIDAVVGVGDGEAVMYAPADMEEVTVEGCAPEELDTEPVGVEEGAEELELVFAKLTTGGPGNVYSIGGL